MDMYMYMYVYMYVYMYTYMCMCIDMYMCMYIYIYIYIYMYVCIHTYIPYHTIPYHTIPYAYMSTYMHMRLCALTCVVCFVCLWSVRTSLLSQRLGLILVSGREITFDIMDQSACSDS